MTRQRGRVNQFGWRYIPNIGKPGAASSHATLYPVDFNIKAGWQGVGRVQWEAPSWEQHPRQAHIISALAQLPIKTYLDCIMTRTIQVLRTDLARELP
jgi:hypothetical protein